MVDQSETFARQLVRALYMLSMANCILRHERRRLISLSVTAHPTAEWIAHQITGAFPWDEAPDHLIRDRDASGRRLGCPGYEVGGI
jgi:hypothetical protein